MKVFQPFAQRLVCSFENGVGENDSGIVAAFSAQECDTDNESYG